MKAVKIILLVILVLAAALLIAAQFNLLHGETLFSRPTPTPTPEPTPEPTPTPEPIVYVDAYAAGSSEMVCLYDESFASAEMCPRGTALRYEQGSDTERDGVVYRKTTLSDGSEAWISTENLTETVEEVIPEQTLYVRSAVNLLEAADSLSLGVLEEKGTALRVTGYDTLYEDGSVRLYRVSDGENEGYIWPWYVCANEAEATAPYDEELQQLHAERGDSYGGGDAGDLDYTPRETNIAFKSEMPETCKTLYIPCYPDCIRNVEEYIAVADECGINAFCVDITDNTAIAYPSDVMAEWNPTNYANAYNSVEDYGAAVQALKDAGYYVIGRIAAFHDDNFAVDHPEWAISNWDGSLKREAGGYWPSVFCRSVWEYKVSLALEAVEWFGFDEIQFDYVRFPDGTYDSEQAGTIDFKNTWGESKAQAIQRFLMYAADVLHENGIRISADVFGETSNTYVAAYGQYWPAISNVVDAISAMPYPDHYDSSGGWNPWEHPYDIINIFASGAATRQTECPTPASVRTWIQCYDSIKSPTVYYYADNVGAEIQALFDNGLTGGYLTWNSGGDWGRYRSCEEAFNIDP